SYIDCPDIPPTAHPRDRTCTTPLRPPNTRLWPTRPSRLRGFARFRALELREHHPPRCEAAKAGPRSQAECWADPRSVRSRPPKPGVGRPPVPGGPARAPPALFALPPASVRARHRPALARDVRPARRDPQGVDRRAPARPRAARRGAARDQRRAPARQVPTP